VNPHADPAQNGTPLAGAEQTMLHAPQLLGSVVVFTQLPPQRDSPVMQPL
jgi:hypothetical protein